MVPLLLPIYNEESEEEVQNEVLEAKQMNGVVES